MSRLPVRTEAQLQPPLVDSPAFVLMQAGQLAMEWIAESLELFGLTIVEYGALAVVAKVGGMSQGTLARRLGLTKPVMSGVVSALVEAGLAERRGDYFDGRVRLVCITRAGAELVAEAADELECIDHRFREHLDEEALKRLAELAPPNLTAMERAFLGH
jgi:MarR family transcriptional regulator, lower aerobic nicotinate degradation pathway regulator